MRLLLLVSLLFVASCENTIRGVGRDAAETVDATENAVERTGRAVTD